jgi:predicted O-methyltransferase YrrM
MEMRPWTPDSLAEVARAFQKSRILLTGAELDIFTRLGREAKSSKELSQELGLDERAATIFMDALAALGLLDKEGSLYRTPSYLYPYLSSESEKSIIPLILHMGSLWRRWGSLSRVLVEGTPEGASPWEERSDEERRAFIGAMHVLARNLAPEIVSSVNLEGVRRMLDVGGASGTYTVAFLRAKEDLRATIFDLPKVIPMARERLEREGLLHRVELVGGDFERDPLPPGHDLVFLSAIVHQNSRSQNRALFAKARDALVPGGRILIRDHVMDPSRTKPVAGAIFAVNMLVSTKGGNTYTFQELEEDLLASGFAKVAWIRRGERMDCLIEAEKAAG